MIPAMYAKAIPAFIVLMHLGLDVVGCNRGRAANAQEEELIAASGTGDLVRVKVLLAAGTDVNAKDKRGNFALLLAATQGHLEVADALLAAGADLNEKNREGQMALIATEPAVATHTKGGAKAVPENSDRVNMNDGSFKVCMTTVCDPNCRMVLVFCDE
jgi:hypothetical protein